MGGLLAYLCAGRAVAAGLPPPLGLFLSAAAAPGRGDVSLPRPVAALPSALLWEWLLAMGGTPPEVTASAAFRQYLEPVLRADFAALENWRQTPGMRLEAPITVFLGTEDRITREDALAWAPLTSGPCRVYSFPGGHFYLREHWTALAGHMARALGVE